MRKQVRACPAAFWHVLLWSAGACLLVQHCSLPINLDTNQMSQKLLQTRLRELSYEYLRKLKTMRLAIQAVIRLQVRA